MWLTPYYYAMNGIYSGGYAVDWILRLLKEDYAFLENLSPHFSSRVPLFFSLSSGGDYEGAKGSIFESHRGCRKRRINPGSSFGFMF